jgi:hypothetical protein
MSIVTKGRWIKKWRVESFIEYDTSYVVSMDAEGVFGCSCPVWKFRRLECKHIKRIKENYLENLFNVTLMDLGEKEQRAF